MAGQVSPGPAALVDLAEAEPASAIRLADDVLVDSSSSVQSRAVALQAKAVAHRLLGAVSDALTTFDASLRLAAATDDDSLVARIRTSRAAALLQSGQAAQALVEVDGVLSTSLGPSEFAFASFQRASSRLVWGQFDDAVADLTVAIPLLDQVGSARHAAHAIGNRGLANAYRGRYRTAEIDMREALGRYDHLGLEVPAADTVQNLGWVAHRRGNVLEALRCYDEAERRHRAIGLGGHASEVDRARALLDVGLGTEASRRAAHVAEALFRTGARVDAGEALLVAANGAAVARRFALATELSRQARVAFEQDGRVQLVVAADLLQLRSRRADGEPTARLLNELTIADQRLDSSADPFQRAEIAVMRAELLVDAGEPAEALTMLRPVRPSTCSIEVRARLWAVRAVAALALGRRSAAIRALHSGVACVDGVRASVGAADVRAGIGVHATGLDAVACDLGATSRSPWRLVGFSELTRAAALRFPRGRLTHAADYAAALRELHALDDDPHSPSVEQRRVLERAVADRRRLGRAPVAGRRPMPTLGSLREGLGDRTLIVLVPVRGELSAVRIDRRRVERVGVGPVEQWRAASTALRRAGDIAVRSTSTRARSLAAAQFERIVDSSWSSLSEALAQPTGDVVVVPPMTLLDFPWAALQGLRELAVVVNPSVTLWWSLLHDQVAPGSVVLVAGHGLEHADAEIEAVGRVWGREAVRVPSHSSRAELMAHLEGAGTAHFAAHHVANADNPLFSAIRVGGGSMFGHDLDAVEQVPCTVVLSSCSAAQVASPDGGDGLGTVLAFLDAGVRTVVASPWLVPDDPQVRSYMVVLHEGLAQGLRPSAAVRNARVTVRAAAEACPAVWAGFGCFGS